MIQGLLFDYGGTIDTNGIHWGEVLWQSYQKLGLAVEKPLFTLAYNFGERSLAINPLVKPEHNFYDILALKVEQQFNFLKENGVDLDRSHILTIAEGCNAFAQENVNLAKPMLVALQAKYPLVMVSNFYGNLRTVLTEFGIIDLFDEVVESAVVGVRKPDAAIYQLGVDALGFPAEDCVVIGDSYAKDIVPAKQTGCKAVWLNKQGWDDDKSKSEEPEYTADVMINDFSQLREAIEGL